MKFSTVTRTNMVKSAGKLQVKRYGLTINGYCVDQYAIDIMSIRKMARTLLQFCSGRERLQNVTAMGAARIGNL
jgi:hypothetical protein